MTIDQKEIETMNKIKSDLKELNTYHEDNIIVIGGIATMLHAQKLEHAYADCSHDAAFFISRTNFSILREYETISKNSRLSKHEITNREYPIDIYIENEAKLAIPFEELLNDSVVIENIRVASLSHLLILKLDAAIDREGSEKGDKDDRDIVQILELNPGKIDPLYLTKNRINKLQRVVESVKPYITITANNKFLASESLNEVLGIAKARGKGYER